jgi:hypothetical protein
MDPRVKPGGDDLLTPPKKKNPAFRRDFPALALVTAELAISLLARIRLTRTVRILLLLAGLLPAALLTLLAGLLTRVLILLTRILVLVRHSEISIVERNGR